MSFGILAKFARVFHEGFHLGFKSVWESVSAMACDATDRQLSPQERRREGERDTRAPF